MTSSKNLEEFWTRGDIHSRVRKAMIEADLIDKKKSLERYYIYLRRRYILHGVYVSSKSGIPYYLLKINLK